MSSAKCSTTIAPPHTTKSLFNEFKNTLCKHDLAWLKRAQSRSKLPDTEELQWLHFYVVPSKLQFCFQKYFAVRFASATISACPNAEWNRARTTSTRAAYNPSFGPSHRLSAVNSSVRHTFATRATTSPTQISWAASILWSSVTNARRPTTTRTSAWPQVKTLSIQK